MEKCYEYFGCNITTCILHGEKDNAHCWNIDETLCNNPAFKLVSDTHDRKKKKTDLYLCSFCIYYKEHALEARDRVHCQSAIEF